MINDVKEALRILLIFIGCTLIFYYGIMWLSKEFGPEKTNPSRNNVIQVNKNKEIYDNDELLRRLRVFFEYGE
jgi:hypothetical protein